MKLDTLIRSDRVFLDLEVGDSREALEVMASHMAAVVGHGARRIHAALEERERLGSTALGDGFAIPHCKLDGISEVTVAMFRFAEAVPCQRQPELLRFAIVVVSPPDEPALHLQALALLARVLKHDGVRRDLLEVVTPDEAVEKLTSANGAPGDHGSGRR